MVSATPYHYGMLWRALAISLLVHAVLLLQPGFRAGSSMEAKTPSLFARLTPNALTTPAPAPTSSPALQKKYAPTPGRPSSSTVTTATTSDVPRAEVRPENVSNAANNVSANTTAAAINAKVDSDSDLDFIEDKKSYLFAIRDEARRTKKYPVRSHTAGWSGKAEILVTVAAGGVVQQPQLQKGSGYSDLDIAALVLVTAAVQRTPVPQSLRKHNFDVTIPIIFNLEDEK